MIRDRLKKAARKAALRAFGMEKQAEDRAPRPEFDREAEIDLSKIPKLVDGDGDTPGPKHMTRIGRTWIAAQIASGVSHCMIDLRGPEEWTAGKLPGAHCVPGTQIKERLDLLPEDRRLRVTVYDSDGGELSDQLASWLREQGWGWARQLQGGWAEWLEHGEPIEHLVPVPDAVAQVGTPVTLASGEHGVVQAIEVSDNTRTYLVLREDGKVTRCGEDDLAE